MPQTNTAEVRVAEEPQEFPEPPVQAVQSEASAAPQLRVVTETYNTNHQSLAALNPDWDDDVIKLAMYA